jgi:hypothetical protein
LWEREAEGDSWRSVMRVGLFGKADNDHDAERIIHLGKRNE